MPRRLFEQMENWAGGINTAATADSLTVGTSPRGINSALVELSLNPPRALAGKRYGSSPALSPVLTAEPTIIGQYYFKKSNGTKIHILVGSDGSIWKRNTDGTHTAIAAAATLTVTDLPAFAVANDLLFILNGTDAKKYNGTSVQKFGLAQASAPTSVTATAGGSMTAGDYDVLLTYYNSATGHESPISSSTEVTLSGGNLSFTVNWAAPADAQVDYVRVYVRQQTRGPNYYRAIAGSTPAVNATHGGFPVATTSAVFDISEAQFDAFRLLAPDTNENYPPPSGALSPTWHRSRMFCHDGSNIYWTEVERPEAFNTVDNYEPVSPDDGQAIVALESAHDKLLILKEHSTWALVGTNPTSWTLELVSPTIGSVNQQCVRTNGRTYWWDALKGPIGYSGSGTPDPIGIAEIGPTIDPEELAKAYIDKIVAEVDDAPSRQRILWAIPEVGETRNTLMLPYNIMLGVWESSGWNPFDVASMCVAEDADSEPWVFIGGYSGRLFQLWNATNDGVITDTVSKGLIVSSTSTVTTVTDEDAASPAWTTDELKELYAYAISQDGLDVQRRRITANTANTFTVSPAWGTTPNSTYTWVVGGIDFQWDTPWIHGGAPFNKKRYEFLFVQISSPDSGVPVTLDVFFDYDDLNVVVSKEIELLGTVVYDTAIYDEDRYVSAVLHDERVRMSRRGTAWRARIRNINPDEELTVLKVAMQSVLQSTKQ